MILHLIRYRGRKRAIAGLTHVLAKPVHDRTGGFVRGECRTAPRRCDSDADATAQQAAPRQLAVAVRCEARFRFVRGVARSPHGSRSNQDDTCVFMSSGVGTYFSIFGGAPFLCMS